jgi:hypothetical protein
LALSTRTQDFHLLDCAHAGRTLKKSHYISVTFKINLI